MGEDEEAAGPSRRLCSGGAGGSDYSDSDESPLIQSELDGDDERMEDERDGIVRIRIPPGEERSTDPHARFPKERGKTLFACGLLVTAGVSNTIVLSAVHEKVPETPPLPDFIFALTPYFPYGLVLAEYIMLSMFVMTVTLVLFHRHRWIVMRRLAFLGALLYFCRCVTMFVTQVPVADVNYHCSPKLKGENATFLNVLIRGLEVVTGLGLQVAGKHVLCGDYIYSGHTIVLTISALFIGQYTPRRWRLVHWTAWILAIAGMFLLIVSRGHYTIDVIISYVICTRVFYAYHTQAANPSLRLAPQNHHRKECWFPVFAFFEGNITRAVPRRYDCPIPIAPILAIIRRAASSPPQRPPATYSQTVEPDRAEYDEIPPSAS